MIAFAGCIPISVRSIPYSSDPFGSTQFRGISNSFDTAPVVRVLVIHGMGTHADDFADDFLDSLALRLQIRRRGACDVIDHFTTSYGTVSTVRRCIYQNRNRTRTLRGYSLTWSPVTEEFENSLLRYDWKVHGRERVHINRDLKEKLIDKSFSDAVLYAGSFAPTLRNTVKRALCVLVLGGPPPVNECTFQQSRKLAERDRSDLFVLSHSLGSMMVIETIGELIESGTRLKAQGKPVSEEVSAAALAGSELIEDIRVIAMLANQLPLLYLARIPEQPTRFKTDLAVFGAATCARSNPTQLSIVAYSDPNDLLSFPLSPGWGSRFECETGKLRFINVPVANNTMAILGALAEPNQAHTGYWTNRTVFRFLVNGHHR